MTKTQTNIFPNYKSRPEVLRYLQSDDRLWDCFTRMPKASRELLIGFFLGQNGLPVTYDTVFQKIFDPEAHSDRLESLLSALFGRRVKIIEILPREGTQLTEKGSFIIMDVLVILEDETYANLEMQKVGYEFPIERNDCYGADVIMRQYTKLKDRLKDHFTFKHLKKVFCIILMEQSPSAFKEHPGEYRHHRYMQFDTGIMKGHTGLHEDIFLCLDIFQQTVHNIDVTSSPLDVWLTFLSATDTKTILNLISEFPEFLPIYQEIAEFATDPEVLMTMFSQELYIMDRNMERLMVTELQEKVAEQASALAEEREKNVEQANALAEKDNALAEKDNALAEKDNALAEKDKLIAELKAQLAQQQTSN